MQPEWTGASDQHRSGPSPGFEASLSLQSHFTKTTNYSVQLRAEYTLTLKLLHLIQKKKPLLAHMSIVRANKGFLAKTETAF